MAGKVIEIKGPGGQTVPAYLALPPSGNGPGVCMGQDIWGNGPLTQRIADRYAEEGYTVLIPDLFWDLEPKTVTDPAGVEQPCYLGLFDRGRCFEVFTAGIQALRAMPECTGKVGVAGFCEGGNHVFMAAARLRIDAAVSYYGTHIHHFLDEADHIGCALMLHMAEHDRTYPDEQRDRILARMTSVPGVDIHIYNAGHGFCRVSSAEYDEEAENTAHARTFALFEKTLR